MRKKYARYGPTDRYDRPPDAGMCISAFALVVQGNGAVLAGIPRRVGRWRQDWLYSKRKDEGQEVFEEWRLPSCYLKEGEDPRVALDRIMRQELGVKEYVVTPETPRVISYYSPSDWYPGRNHWDLAIVYTVKSPRGSSSPMMKRAVVGRFWRELAFLKRGGELRSKEFGWNRELMVDLNLI